MILILDQQISSLERNFILVRHPFFCGLVRSTPFAYEFLINVDLLMISYASNIIRCYKVIVNVDLLNY